MPLFQKSNIRMDCERCSRQFRIGEGGVCSSCRLMLCDAHLHGTLARRLLVNLLGATSVCVACREKAD